MPGAREALAFAAFTQGGRCNWRRKGSARRQISGGEAWRRAGSGAPGVHSHRSRDRGAEARAAGMCSTRKRRGALRHTCDAAAAQRAAENIAACAASAYVNRRRPTGRRQVAGARPGPRMGRADSGARAVEIRAGGARESRPGALHLKKSLRRVSSRREPRGRLAGAQQPIARRPRLLANDWRKTSSPVPRRARVPAGPPLLRLRHGRQHSSAARVGCHRPARIWPDSPEPVYSPTPPVLRTASRFTAQTTAALHLQPSLAPYLALGREPRPRSFRLRLDLSEWRQ